MRLRAALAAVLVALCAACGGTKHLTASEVVDAFRVETGLALLSEPVHDPDDEVFLMPASSRAQIDRYGDFALVVYPHEIDLVDGVWNRDGRGWAYQTTYANVGLLWRPGRTKAVDERWRRLDRILRKIAG